MDERANKFYAKVEKYGGWQQVSTNKIHLIFEEVLKPAEMGFVQAKRGYVARQVNSDIHHVIKLDALKGGAYGLSYGLSLSYVPYPYFPKLKWHKTLKSISLDLREQPQVHWTDSMRSSPAPEAYLASGMLGEECFREELERAWNLCSARIVAWFASTSDFVGILTKCGECLSSPRPAVRYLPGARLVRAFTYAKTGRLQEARTDLRIFLSENQESDQARENLFAAIEGMPLK